MLTQPGLEEHLSPCLSWNSFRFLPPLKNKQTKKQLSLSVLISFPISPTTFNNQLAFQLFFFSPLLSMSPFAEEPEAGRALVASQSN